MSFGLLSTGFVPKSLADVKASVEESLKSSLGPGINLSADSPLGQIVGVLSLEISDIWEAMELVHASQYPDSAEGASLEDAVAITGTVRRAASKSYVTGRIYGTPATVIAAGFIASVYGNTASRFVTLAEETIGADGIDEQQTIAFSATPTAGTWKLRYDGTQTTSSLAYGASAGDVQTALNSLSDLSAVTVTGTAAAGYVVTFAGADGEQDQPLLEVVESGLTATGVAVTSTVTETVKGFPPYVDAAMEAETAGTVQAPAGSLIVVETTGYGSAVEGVYNLLDAVVGLATETDSDLHIRWQTELRRTGSATLIGIQNAVAAVENVTMALANENTGDTVDGAGRPAHSIEIVAEGGDVDDIAAAIFSAKPAGVQTFGIITRSVTDSQGLVHSVSFNRPADKNIYVVAEITKNTDQGEGDVYPADGDAQIAAAILAYGDEFDIGQDVIVNKFWTPINAIPGVIGIVIKVGFSAAPTGTVNLAIASNEIAVFDSSRITVTSA